MAPAVARAQDVGAVMRVLVCGGRNFCDLDGAHNRLDAMHYEKPISLIIEGGASGADRLGREWAGQNRVDSDTYFADWKTHGKAAGPIRNQRMIDEGKPDLVLAFPGGRGTADMVRRARTAGIEVVEVR